MTVVAAIPEAAEFADWTMAGADPREAAMLRTRVVDQVRKKGGNPETALRGLGFRPPRQQRKQKAHRPAQRRSPTSSTRRPSTPAPPSSAPASTRSSTSRGQSAKRALLGPAPQVMKGGVGRGLGKVVTAIAFGLIVLEVGASVTGQYFSFNLKTPKTPAKPDYRPLYGGATSSQGTPFSGIPPGMWPPSGPITGIPFSPISSTGPSI